MFQANDEYTQVVVATPGERRTREKSERPRPATPPGGCAAHFATSLLTSDVAVSHARITTTMNARMSRLRRSLSRSVHQLSMSRSNSLNGLIELPTSSYTTLVDRFAR
ncbi:hypothetical protein ANCDUO_09813 [Ancylostoma duodenale]|uniref:Uncharacterized protein n=1 Tax=Ancylostoma duodenale TaxID=51022 RepID=A0A0C2GFN2_9BILA|nr:hypothetical protein ANCDUO_09813 [Ancylostoma duodenale]